MSTKLEKANQWLMLITNLGVVAGFVLIAIQLQQNTRALEVQARAISASTAVAAESAFMGENVAEAYAIAQLRPSELTDGQLQQVGGYLTTKLWSVNQIYDNFNQGLATEQQWQQQKNGYVREYSFPVARAYWTSTAQFWPPDFAAEIDKEYLTSNGKEVNHTAEFRKALDKELNASKQ